MGVDVLYSEIVPRFMKITRQKSKRNMEVNQQSRAGAKALFKLLGTIGPGSVSRRGNHLSTPWGTWVGGAVGGTVHNVGNISAVGIRRISASVVLSRPIGVVASGLLPHLLVAVDKLGKRMFASITPLCQANETP